MGSEEDLGDGVPKIFGVSCELPEFALLLALSGRGAILRPGKGTAEDLAFGDDIVLELGLYNQRLLSV